MTWLASLNNCSVLFWPKALPHNFSASSQRSVRHVFPLNTHNSAPHKAVTVVTWFTNAAFSTAYVNDAGLQDYKELSRMCTKTAMTYFKAGRNLKKKKTVKRIRADSRTWDSEILNSGKQCEGCDD
jgi:hypothetical protein